jgi:hypothetical protein
MKIRTEVEELKAQWAADPCWDLHTTEGFEDYRAELLDYADKMLDLWAKRDHAVRQCEMRRIGLLTEHPYIVGKDELFDYIKALEARIQKLESLVLPSE